LVLEDTVGLVDLPFGLQEADVFVAARVTMNFKGSNGSVEVTVSVVIVCFDSSDSCIVIIPTPGKSGVVAITLLRETGKYEEQFAVGDSGVEPSDEDISSCGALGCGIAQQAPQFL